MPIDVSIQPAGGAVGDGRGRRVRNSVAIEGAGPCCLRAWYAANESGALDGVTELRCDAPKCRRVWRSSAGWWRLGAAPVETRGGARS